MNTISTTASTSTILAIDLGKYKCVACVLDEATGEVRCSGQHLDLRLSERRLLAILMRRCGTVVPKTALEEALSQFGRELSLNAVEVLVSRVRKALGDASSGLAIETVRGVGYLLREEVQQ